MGKRVNTNGDGVILLAGGPTAAAAA